LREEIESAALLKVGTPGREVYRPETERKEKMFIKGDDVQLYVYNINQRIEMQYTKLLHQLQSSKCNLYKDRNSLP
jgi:hypothetical protein